MIYKKQDIEKKISDIVRDHLNDGFVLVPSTTIKGNFEYLLYLKNREDDKIFGIGLMTEHLAEYPRIRTSIMVGRVDNKWPVNDIYHKLTTYYKLGGDVFVSESKAKEIIAKRQKRKENKYTINYKNDIKSKLINRKALKEDK